MKHLLPLVVGAEGLPVVVVGDSVLDGWLRGPSTRLSREAPVPVVDVTDTRYAAGGAANTAVNLAAMGADVRFVSVTGDDADGELLRDVLRAAGVDVRDVLVEPGRATCAKRRVSAGAQMLTRIDTGSTAPVSDATRTRLRERLRLLAPGAAAVVVSDYDLGLFGEQAVEVVRSLEHPCVVVDARRPRRWAGARPRAVKPNFAEVEPLLGPGLDRAERIVAAAEAVREALGADVVAATLDGEGAVLLSGDEPVRLHTTPQPDSHAAGAGDSFTAALALALAQGASPADAGELAQAAAAVVVRSPGTTPCTADDLRASLSSAEQHVRDVARLADLVAEHRRRGRTIAFTNGCFDVLHAGHVAHLREARSLADVLVVGLNSDASVRRLKGPDRPVNGVEDRAAVLAGLVGVDHLVVFDTDTPAELLEAVTPDVYVKGGDYTPEMLPGDRPRRAPRRPGRHARLGRRGHHRRAARPDPRHPVVRPLDVLVPTSGRPGALAVTLTALACSTVRDLRVVVSDQSPGAPSYDDPVVQAVVRVLRHHGTDVELAQHLPRRGMAEHRAHLLSRASAPRVLFLDDDVLLEPDAVEVLLAALDTSGAGFVAMAMQGLTFADDERPAEQVAYEEWDGPVAPERVRKDTPGWERWRLHNAANLVHLDRRLGPHPRGYRLYRLAWAAGCVLFDRQALLDAGGFGFWTDLPPASAGEDVVAQLRVLERSGGAGVLPSGAWHLELPTSVGDRRVDAYAVVIGNPD